MIFKIKIEKFWMNGEHELEPALKRHIVKEVVAQISAEIQGKVDELMLASVKQATDNMMAPAIDEAIAEFMKDGLIKKKTDYSSGKDAKLMPVKEYVEALFSENNHMWSPAKHIDAYCKKFGEDMKNQYNAAFATKIVMNLRDQGMLKDEVINALLAPPKNASQE